MLFWACWFHVWGPLGEKNKFDRICVDVTQGFVGFKLDLRWEIGVFRSCCWKIDFVSLPCLYADTSRYKHARKNSITLVLTRWKKKKIRNINIKYEWNGFMKVGCVSTGYICQVGWPNSWWWCQGPPPSVHNCPVRYLSCSSLIYMQLS